MGNLPAVFLMHESDHGERMKTQKDNDVVVKINATMSDVFRS